MSIEKVYRPLVGPSFTPAPSGIGIDALAHGTNGQLLIGQTGSATLYKTVSGDVTITNNGVTAIGAGKVTSAMLEAALIKYATVNLSAANIIAMNGAPVEILPTPGSNKILVVSQIVFEMKRTATAFTGGGAVNFQYHTTTSSVPHAGTIAGSNVTTGGAGTVVVVLGPNVGTNGLVVPSNEAIDITNATAAFADGTGTAVVTIYYRTITLA